MYFASVFVLYIANFCVYFVESFGLKSRVNAYFVILVFRSFTAPFTIIAVSVSSSV